MRKVLEPVITMCCEDRESMFLIETKESSIMKRLDLLEGAIFLKNGKIGKTVFDEYEEKITNTDLFVKNKILAFTDKFDER